MLWLFQSYGINLALGEWHSPSAAWGSKRIERSETETQHALPTSWASRTTKWNTCRRDYLKLSFDKKPKLLRIEADEKDKEVAAILNGMKDT
jgi:hypothetical protein